MLIQADSTHIALAKETLYWARVSGLSDAIIALLGLTGIVSILVTRWGLLSQAKRAQVEDAVVLCEEMRKEIVPPPSMHFNHGLADPNVAFLPCATVYSSVVVVLYASIITQRHNDPRSGPYQNVVELFDRWYKKERMEKIQEEVAKLQDAGVFKAPPKK